LVNFANKPESGPQAPPVELRVRRHPKAEEFLQVKGWNSNYKAVDTLLAHLMRKSKSKGSRRLYIWHLHKFCEYTGARAPALADSVLDSHTFHFLIIKV
jgi:hypothetical protein